MNRDALYLLCLKSSKSFVPCFSPTGQKNATEMLEGLIARSERKLNETFLSAKASELNEEAKENLKREILEEVAKNFTKVSLRL